jgi:AcrR family transcriptional regulator
MNQNKKQFRSKESKKRIINATMRLMAVKGYGNTSISDISKETGLTKGALYHHYHNKEEIFENTILSISDILKQRLMDSEFASLTSLQRLNQLFDSFIELFEENNHYYLIISSLVLEMEGNRVSFAQPLVGIFSDISPFIERIIVKGQASQEISPDFDVKLLSLNIIGMLFGNTIPWILNKDKTNYRAMMESQKDLLLRSIKHV